MLNNSNKRECGFAGDVVAYIYDEIDTASKAHFKDHLAGCAKCTAEVAGTSNVRFSLGEWQKHEFAHLPTPEIVIPYDDMRSEPAGRNDRPGFAAGLRDLFAAYTRPLAASFAVVLCLLIAIVALTYLDGNEQALANKGEQPAPPVQNTSVSKEAPVPLPGSDIATTVTPEPDVSAASPVGRRQKRAVAVPAGARPAKTPFLQRPVQAVRKAPVLTTFDEADDNSPRLADLFDEVGG